MDSLPARWMSRWGFTIPDDSFIQFNRVIDSQEGSVDATTVPWLLTPLYIEYTHVTLDTPLQQRIHHYHRVGSVVRDCRWNEWPPLYPSDTSTSLFTKVLNGLAHNANLTGVVDYLAMYTLCLHYNEVPCSRPPPPVWDERKMKQWRELGSIEKNTTLFYCIAALADIEVNVPIEELGELPDNILLRVLKRTRSDSRGDSRSDLHYLLHGYPRVPWMGDTVEDIVLTLHTRGLLSYYVEVVLEEVLEVEPTERSLRFCELAIELIDG